MGVQIVHLERFARRHLTRTEGVFKFNLIYISVYIQSMFIVMFSVIFSPYTDFKRHVHRTEGGGPRMQRGTDREGGAERLQVPLLLPLRTPRGVRQWDVWGRVP